MEQHGEGLFGSIGKFLVTSAGSLAVKHVLKGDHDPKVRLAIGAASALLGGLGGAMVWFDHKRDKKKQKKAEEAAVRNTTDGWNNDFDEQHGFGLSMKDVVHHHVHMAFKHLVQPHHSDFKKYKLTKAHDIPLHISQLGINGKKLLKLLERHEGSGKVGSTLRKLTHKIAKGVHKADRGINKGLAAIGKTTKKVGRAGIHKLKDFANGKTKLKPSQIVSYLGGAVAMAGTASAVIPGVDLISVPAATIASLGLGGLATVMKTAGRGLRLPGGGKYPQRYPGEKHMMVTGPDGKKHRAEYCGPGTNVKERQKLGIKPIGPVDAVCEQHDLAYQDITDNTTMSRAQRKKAVRAADKAMLQGLAGNRSIDALKARTAIGTKNALEDVHLMDKLKFVGSGKKLPKVAQLLLNNNPRIANTILRAAMKMGGSGTCGSGKVTDLLKEVGVNAAHRGARALMKFAMENPEARKFILNAITGSGAEPVTMGHGRPKKVGSKREVYNGSAEHTAGGLVKSDLMVNKRGRVVSKKQHARGQALYKNYAQ